MKPWNKDKWPMLCSFAGSFLLFFTSGIYLYWGNVSVYTNSYLRNKLGPDPSIKSPWVVSLVTLGVTTGTTVSGYLAGYLGHRRTMILGCMLLNAGVFLTYFSVQRSVQAVNVSMGVFAGLGTGLIFGMGYVNIASFDPKNLGLVTATIEMSISGGSAVLNQLVTYYVNPNNLTPDIFDGREKYFDQDEVLDNVPSVFFLMGFFNLCFHVIGLFLFRNPKPREENIHPCLQTDKNDNKHSSECADIVNGEEKTKLSPVPSAKGIPNGIQHEEKTETMADTHTALALTKNLSPTQILKCRSFYILWLSTGCCDYSYILMNNFYKSYGQTQISDDQFMANVSSFLLVAMMLSRPMWGIIIDICGVKSSMAYFSCVQCIASTFWYFTPMVSRWLYLFWTMLMAMSNGGLYVLLPVGLLRLYGKAHFSANYGWVASSTLVLNVVAPSIIQFLLARFGWFYLFFSAACGNAVIVCLCIMAFQVSNWSIVFEY